MIQICLSSDNYCTGGKLVKRRVGTEGHDGLQPDFVAAKHCDEGSLGDPAEENEGT